MVNAIQQGNRSVRVGVKELGCSHHLKMALACVPLVGAIVSHTEHQSFMSAIREKNTLFIGATIKCALSYMTNPEEGARVRATQVEHKSDLLKLIKAKNHLKMVDVARNLLSAALIVATVAGAVFGSGVFWALAVASIFTIIAVRNIYHIHLNTQISNKIEQNSSGNGAPFIVY